MYLFIHPRSCVSITDVETYIRITETTMNNYYVVLLFKSFIHSYSDANVTGIDGTNLPSIFNRNFQCTGDEAHLTDCVISNVNNKICGNKRVGLICETGNIHK